MNLKIVEVDFAERTHTAGIVAVLDSYARDPVGGGQPLTGEVRSRLIPALENHPSRLVLLALDGRRAVGVAVCFFGFSTFQARWLLNIHDLAVVPACRGQGVGRALLVAAETSAIERDCCRLTLEVQENNLRARRLYESFGFADYELGSSQITRFLVKPLAVSGPGDPHKVTWPGRAVPRADDIEEA